MRMKKKDVRICEEKNEEEGKIGRKNVWNKVGRKRENNKKTFCRLSFSDQYCFGEGFEGGERERATRKC